MSREPASPRAEANRPRSLLARLVRDPRRFGFDAAVRILMRARKTDDPAEAAHFRTPPGLTFPAADVQEVRRGDVKPDVTVGLMGLTGPSGVMPRYYTEFVTQTLRGGSTALHSFLDMLGGRFVAFFAGAAIKYRPARAAETAASQVPPKPDAITQVLLALTGYATPHLADRLACGTEPLLHYAGLFAMRPRSADRLSAMLSDWLGMKVEVVEFAGAWLPLPPDQRSRIGANGAFCQLGVDASAGVRAWNPEARIILRIGPLTRDGFDHMLPDSTTLHRMVALVRAFIGMETGFAVNPIMAGAAVPLLRLDSTAVPPPRLGWNTWLPIPGGGFLHRTDADDALFDVEMIEAWSTAARRTA